MIWPEKDMLTNNTRGPNSPKNLKTLESAFRIESAPRDIEWCCCCDESVLDTTYKCTIYSYNTSLLITLGPFGITLHGQLNGRLLWVMKRAKGQLGYDFWMGYSNPSDKKGSGSSTGEGPTKGDKYDTTELNWTRTRKWKSSLGLWDYRRYGRGELNNRKRIINTFRSRLFFSTFPIFRTKTCKT